MLQIRYIALVILCFLRLCKTTCTRRSDTNYDSKTSIFYLHWLRLA